MPTPLPRPAATDYLDAPGRELDLLWDELCDVVEATEATANAAPVAAGVPGGQTLIGGTQAADRLTLQGSAASGTSGSAPAIRLLAGDAVAAPRSALAQSGGARAPVDGAASPAEALLTPLQAAAGPAWNAVVEHLAALVERAESLEALQASLLAAYDGLPLADLRAVLAAGLAVAQLAGLADVQDETGAARK